MDLAARILVVGGVANLVYGFVTGYVLGQIRAAAPDAPKYLMLAHTGPLMIGPMLLGLVFALGLSPLSPAVETSAAVLLVAGSALQAIGNTVNWRAGIRDEFVERGAGYYLVATAGLILTIGLIVIVVGVVAGL